MFVERIIPNTKMHRVGIIENSLILKQVVHIATTVFGWIIKSVVFE
jgi:hypothetical protein